MTVGGKVDMQKYMPIAVVLGALIIGAALLFHARTLTALTGRLKALEQRTGELDHRLDAFSDELPVMVGQAGKEAGRQAVHGIFEEVVQKPLSRLLPKPGAAGGGSASNTTETAGGELDLARLLPQGGLPVIRFDIPDPVVNVHILPALREISALPWLDRLFGGSSGKGRDDETASAAWLKDFDLSERTMLSSGRNPYFILEPGYRLELADADDRLVITVLDKTLEISGVTTRVVEEREWDGGELVEISSNYYAMCRDSGDMFYFGEDVAVYEDGRVTGHGGAWRAGVNGAAPGLLMPGQPWIGMKYYQEQAPGVALDRAEIVSFAERVKTPAGAFHGCLRTREGSGLNPLEHEFKLYAPGVGLIQEEGLLLTKFGFAGESAAGE